MPTRVQKDGVWTPVDATLVRNAADGTYSPTATPNDVSLSGGGTGPLATLTDPAGHSMALTMPFALPAPSVSGDTALYASVLPGVDLSVSVTDQGGFSDVLIVHDAQAAANPLIKDLNLDASTQGLTLASTPSGGMEASTSDGTLAYTSPRPIMWDSSSTATAAPASQMQRAQSLDESVGAGGGTTVSSVDGPGAGAQVNEVAMTATSSTITLTPDASVLTDPDTRYPVFIDPYTNPWSPKSGHFAEVYSNAQCAGTPKYDTPQTNGEGVGYQRWGGDCGNGIERSYYAFDISDMHPVMNISQATFTAAATYAGSWDCSQNQPITLHTTGSISDSTDWNTRPGTLDGTYAPVTAHIPSASNPNSSCSNHTATFDVTPQAQTAADGDFNSWTVGLYGNEAQSDSNNDYLRFSTVIQLHVTYDVAPAVPTKLSMDPNPVNPSGACPGTGWIGATTYSSAGSNVHLHATVTANVTDELVSAEYHVWDNKTDSGDGTGASMGDPSSGYLASGQDADVLIGFTLKDGHAYGWNVHAKDNSPAHLTSANADSCHFDTDFTPPDTPDIGSNPSFPRVGGGSPNPIVYAGIGHTTTFPISAQDGAPADTCTLGSCLSSGVDHFLWRLDSQPTTSTGTSVAVTATSGGVASATASGIPITTWGVHTLYVVAVDKAGNLSQAPASYTFTVPWDPNTKITPGDISGDGVADLLGTTSTGDLELIPGDNDPAQTAKPAQTGPLTGTPPAITGPVTVSTAADSPDAANGTDWRDYLIAHRGNLKGGDYDDLLAYNLKTNQLYAIKNDLDPADGGGTYSTYPGFLGKRAPDVLNRPDCDSTGIIPANRCGGAGYNSTTPWDIAQLVAPGDVTRNGSYPALITVENKQLWFYQISSGPSLVYPTLLGDGDWSGLDLITPGTVASGAKGTYTLWARDKASGTLYTYPLTLDANGLPPLLHAPVRTPLTSALTTTAGGTLCLDDSKSATTNHNPIQIYTCNGSRAQRFAYLSDGSLRVLGKCLDVTDSGTTNGTLVQLYTCNNTGAQQWTAGPSGSLLNPQSGKCLDDPDSSTTNGTQVEIYTCNNTPAQNWTSSAPTGWNTNPATALAPVLPSVDYPTVASPGDVNSPAGDPDGNPDLYATDTNGRLTEYPGAAPTGTTATFGATANLGNVTNTATHWWNLNDGAAAGTTATDRAAGLSAKLTGAAGWATGTARGTVLNLTGTTGYAATSGPAVDTTGSFTVSAWVKLNSLTSNSTFVSQSDDPSVGAANGFQLYYSSGRQVWAFNRKDDDTTSTSFSAAYGAKATTGQWTHLVGVYDADTDQLSLYVNGSLSATETYDGTTWNATGPVQIGRRLYQGAYGEYANAQISNVRIYNTALPPADASATSDNPTLTQID
ncbi:LamG-like jellyroll fold domain-containing protein [Peterkaempfera sp. SMS 1(5)a]|uniref:LamG-like jellyroll fold domain-containing protein n=1 Tax=Peterkaempfera podocarpi TaxID=3232308 RepID=UPI00366E75C3